MKKPIVGDIFRFSVDDDLIESQQRNSGLILPAESEMDSVELGLEETLTDLLSKGNSIPPDLRIDDRDFKEFPNFLEFCISKQGADQAPFARQLEIATKLFAEWCPKCTAKRSDPLNTKSKTFNFARHSSMPVDMNPLDFVEHVQFLEFGVCPRCKSTRSEMYNSGELNVYEEFDGCVGQRAGKSGSLSLMIPYVTHKYIKLQRPVEAFGLLKNSILVGTVVGLTFQKAVELLWTPIHNVFSSSPFFTGYHEMLDMYGEKYGEELYKFKDTFIQYPHRSLMLHPSGPNKRTLRGATRFISAIDELGWFMHGEEDDTKERTSANEVYTSLDNSLTTVRKAAKKLLASGQNNIPMGYSMNISSPQSYQDKIMTLVRQYEHSSRVLTFHGATWDYNPTLSKEDFADKYRTDPIKAERDFGANPPMSENPYIEDISYIDRSAKGKRNRVAYKYKACKSTNDQRQRYGEITKTVADGQIPAHVLAMDAGYSNNSFAIALGYVKKKNDKLYPTISSLIEIAPKKNVCVLNYTKIAKHIIYPLIEHFNVQLVSADRWNSIKLLQDIEEEFGIRAEQYSPNAADFQYVTDHFLDQDKIITIPKPEISVKQIEEMEIDGYPHCFGPGNKLTGEPMPVAHFIHQCMTVTENSRGMPDKGQGYTDDLFRAAYQALIWLLDEESVIEYELLGASKQRGRVSVGAVSGSNRGGGRGKTSSSVGCLAGSGAGYGGRSGGSSGVFSGR